MPARPARSRLLPWLTLPLRALLAALAGFELACVGLFHRVVRPRYRIEGRCQHNGVCCHHLLVVEQRWMRWPGIAPLLRLWLLGVRGLRASPNLVELPDGSVARIHSCDHHDASGRCRVHALRPLACRRYPRPGYFVPPQLHRGCGYRVVDRATGQVLHGDAPLRPGEVAARYDRGALVARWRGTPPAEVTAAGSDRED